MSATNHRAGRSFLSVAGRAFADSRTRTFAFGYLFVAVTYAQLYGYRHTYTTLAERAAFQRSFGDNKAVRLLYGEPRDLLTTGGYVSWRVAATLAIFGAIWALTTTVRAMRGEEEAGRAELVLSGIAGRGKVFAAHVAALGAGMVVLWTAMVVALLIGRLHVGDSLFLAVATISVIPVFAGVGALASQLAPTRRIATMLGSGVLGAVFLVRVIADTESSASWLRWLTPLGWVEEMRPFTGARPLVLLAPLAVAVMLLVASERIARHRDVGSGLLPVHDSAAPDLTLLGSPAAQALRDLRGTLIVWLSATAVYAVILGVVSDAVTSGISDDVARRLSALGVGSIATPSGYLSFVFLVFMLLAALFVCGQVGGMRREESEQRLETLLALAVARRVWFVGRLALAASGATALSVVAGVLAWAGATSQGADVSLGDMLEASVNCVPLALLFLGAGAFVFAVVPRGAPGILYGLVAATFLWELIGSLLSVPAWLLGLSPFHHVALVPAEPFDVVAAAAMVGVAVVLAAAAVWRFERRDLVV